MCWVLLNEIKQELRLLAILVARCPRHGTLTTVLKKFEVQVYIALYVATKCVKLDTVMTQCKLGSLLFAWNSIVYSWLKLQAWLKLPDWLSKEYLKILGYLSKLRSSGSRPCPWSSANKHGDARLGAIKIVMPHGRGYGYRRRALLSMRTVIQTDWPGQNHTTWHSKHQEHVT